ncbi:MAG: tyrosine-type recombinase/integrase [Pirellulaceae bacterium]
MRLRAALDQVTQLAGRKQQMPLRNRAVFILGLDTALRAFEIATLNYDQYQGKYLKRVKGKASIYADVYLSADARRELDQYIAQERGTQPGALFVTNRGGMMSRQQIDRFLKTVAAQANAKLPPDEQINLHAHMLRHTSTKRVYEKRGRSKLKNMDDTRVLSNSNVTPPRRSRSGRRRWIICGRSRNITKRPRQNSRHRDEWTWEPTNLFETS